MYIYSSCFFSPESVLPSFFVWFVSFFRSPQFILTQISLYFFRCYCHLHLALISQLKIRVDRLLSSGSTGPKEISSLFLLETYWTHKWYISVLTKIDHLIFSAAPPFCPVTCNNSWTGFKLGRKNAIRLWVGGIKNYLNTCLSASPLRYQVALVVQYAPQK